MKKNFQQIIENISHIFSAKNLRWHLLAIILTALAVFSGFDWWYFTHTRGVALQTILFPAIVFGGLLPIVVPLVLLSFGALTKNKNIKIFSLATTQAVILGALISGFYKSLTGRIQPPLHGLLLATTENLVDNSHGFRFGFWRGGVFWGWPSSHTTIAFAMAITLFMLLPKNKLARACLVIYALYVGIGVSTNIHWFSDFVAGAILGSLIGRTIGKSYLFPR